MTGKFLKKKISPIILNQTVLFIPEYGTDGLVSTKCDVYSFGILVMETFSRRNPADDMFGGDFSLKQLVIDALSDSVIRVVDTNLLMPEDEYFGEKLQCVKSIMELALSCCLESPGERINFRDVVVALITSLLLYIQTFLFTLQIYQIS